MPESETKLIDKLKGWHNAAADVNAEWEQRAKEAYRFYTGIQQWDPAVIEILVREGRPALTINHVFPVINMLSGYQRQNRSDIRLYPRRRGTVLVASIGTQLIKHTMDTCDGVYALSDAFHDGLIGGKGWVGADQEFTVDPINGDLVVNKESPFDILEDQNNKDYDLNKGAYVFKRYWWNQHQVELQYPKKKGLLSEATSSAEWASEKYSQYPTEDDYGELGQGGFDEDAARAKTHYLIKECWYKEWENCVFLVHVPTLKIRRLKKTQAKRLYEQRPDLLTSGEWRVVERPAPVMHKVVAVGDMVLEHVENPLGNIALFPFFRFCPYWVDGYIMGVVDNLLDPQKEINKNRSQVLHNLNQSVNSGIKVAKVMGDYDKQLAKFGSKPGVILDESKAGGKIERMDPPPLDQGHFLLSQQGAKDIKDISGVNPDMMGTKPEQTESGRARLIRQTAGLTVSEIIFDNFRRTQRQLGLFLWEVIRDSEVYSDEEIVAVVEESHLKGFMQVDEVTGEQTIDLSPMRSWKQGRYGVKVSQSPNLPTIRLANFEQMLECVRLGIPIPPEMIMELSDVPNKEEIIAFLKRLAATQAAAAGQTQQPQPAGAQ